MDTGRRGGTPFSSIKSSAVCTMKWQRRWSCDPKARMNRGLLSLPSTATQASMCGASNKHAGEGLLSTLTQLHEDPSS